MAGAVLVAAAGILHAACGDAPAAAREARGATGVTTGEQAERPAGVTLRSLARGEQSNVEASKQAVARTTAQWATLWKEHEWERPAPAVDFTKEMAVAVFLGTQQSAGVTVRIVEVTPRPAGGVLIRYRVTRPGAGQVAAQVLTFPHDIVAVPTHEGPYVFEQVE